MAILAHPLEEEAVAIARRHGAKGISILDGRGIGFPEHKTFLGQTYQGLESTLLFLSDEIRAPRIAEALTRELHLLERFNGLAFTLPVDHADGIDIAAMAHFLDDEESAAR
ncbi:MAG: hypothetical protein PHQ14_12420 [Chromatiales bacterium]|nr:hypothetical protein [Chromatiales bacterium]